MNLSTVGALSASAEGCTISEIVETDGGVHTNLSDGRVIILCDVSVIYIGTVEEQTIQ